MKKIIFFLITFLIITVLGLIYVNSQYLIEDLSHLEKVFNCCLIGGLGGILYCLRAIYLNKSVKNQWAKEWEIWYYLRPITSMISGGISFMILNAGLLVLESDFSNDSSNYGVYTLAFIAGLNVDRFISKIEDLAKTTWGIDKSRSSKNSDKEKD